MCACRLTELALHALTEHNLALCVENLADHIGSGTRRNERCGNRRRTLRDIVRIAVEVEFNFVTHCSASWRRHSATTSAHARPECPIEWHEVIAVD